MPMRKPFTPPRASAAGDTLGAGQATPLQAGQTGPQPTMPMGGRPQGAAVTPLQPPMLPQMSGAVPANAGGPTTPLNIDQMLLANSERPQQAGQQPPMPPLATLAPFGDQGTRPSAMTSNAPARVPLTGFGMSAPVDDADESGAMLPGAAGQAGPTVMMRLLRTLGRI